MSPTLLTNGLQSYQHGGSVEEQSKYTNKAVGETSNEYVLNVAFWTFILFTIAEAFFAVIAGSQSMLEDAEAMAVDALTYFFNLWAEKVKHRPLSEREERMLPVVRQHHKERTRLYMELIPPLISVFTLLVVTVNALQDAFESLRTPENNEEDVNVIVMMTFSALNMLLDIVNVACFAKAHQAFGLSEVRKEPFSNSTRNTHHSAEFESMLSPKDGQSLHSTSADGDEIDEKMSVNLNMCSAWTVSRFCQSYLDFDVTRRFF
jgi:Co/Zn/Cd efflux system component